MAFVVPQRHRRRKMVQHNVSNVQSRAQIKTLLCYKLPSSLPQSKGLQKAKGMSWNQVHKKVSTGPSCQTQNVLLISLRKPYICARRRKKFFHLNKSCNPQYCSNKNGWTLNTIFFLCWCGQSLFHSFVKHFFLHSFAIWGFLCS